MKDGAPKIPSAIARSVLARKRDLAFADERSPDNAAAALRGKILDAHRGGIGVGAREVEPELDDFFRDHSGTHQCGLRECSNRKLPARAVPGFVELNNPRLEAEGFCRHRLAVDFFFSVIRRNPESRRLFELHRNKPGCRPEFILSKVEGPDDETSLA
jgi:hypothetical protein